VHTIVVSILLPPTGELENSGDGSSPTDEQMSEELQARQDFIDVCAASGVVEPVETRTLYSLLARDRPNCR